MKTRTKIVWMALLAIVLVAVALWLQPVGVKIIEMNRLPGDLVLSLPGSGVEVTVIDNRALRDDQAQAEFLAWRHSVAMALTETQRLCGGSGGVLVCDDTACVVPSPRVIGFLGWAQARTRRPRRAIEEALVDFGAPPEIDQCREAAKRMRGHSSQFSLLQAGPNAACLGHYPTPIGQRRVEHMGHCVDCLDDLAGGPVHVMVLCNKILRMAPNAFEV